MSIKRERRAREVPVDVDELVNDGIETVDSMKWTLGGEAPVEERPIVRDGEYRVWSWQRGDHDD